MLEAPVVFIYSAMMAATAVQFVWDSTTMPGQQNISFEQQLKFLIKVVRECESAHPAAKDASRQLQRELSVRKKSTETRSASFTHNVADNHDLVDSSDPSSAFDGWLSRFSCLDWSGMDTSSAFEDDMSWLDGAASDTALGMMPDELYSNGTPQSVDYSSMPTTEWILPE